MGILPVLVCLLVIPAAHAQTARAPSGEFQLAGIEAKGIKRLSRADIAKLAGLEIGTPVRVDLLQAVAEKLAASGVFTKVEYAYTTTAGRLTLTLNLEEAEWEVPVVFDNFVWFTDPQLTEAVRDAFPTFDGTVPQNEHVPDRIVRALQAQLQARTVAGTVTFLQHTDLKGSLQFVFKVADPGPVTCHVTLTGVSPEPQGQMQTAIASLIGQPYSRLYVSGMVNATLLDTYRRLGFWGATFASPAASLDGTCSGVSVTLNANEGVPYAWQGAEWRGNAVLDVGTLDKLLGMKAGDTADLSRINAGLRAIAGAYGRRGHLQAGTRLSPRLDAAAKQAVFEIEVSEGREFRMGSLEVVGFSEADAAAIGKRWKLAPGEIYNTALVDEFLAKDLSAYRRPGLKAPAVQTRTDVDRAIVDVRVVQER